MIIKILLGSSITLLIVSCINNSLINYDLDTHDLIADYNGNVVDFVKKSLSQKLMKPQFEAALGEEFINVYDARKISLEELNEIYLSSGFNFLEKKQGYGMVYGLDADLSCVVIFDEKHKIIGGVNTDTGQLIQF